MTALIVISAIILFIAFLLFMPVVVYAEFQNELCLSIRWLFIKIRLLPEKPKKEKKKEKKKRSDESAKKKDGRKKDSENPGAIKKILKKTGVGGFIEIAAELAKIAGKGAMGIIRHIVISKLYVRIDCGGEDAAKTAVNYGYISAALYPSASVILGNVKKYRSADIQLYPDYDSQSSSVECNAVIKVKLWWIVLSAVKMLVKFLKELMKLKKEEII